MYSKTRLGSDQIEGALSLTPRGRRMVYLVVAIVVAAGVAAGVWSGVSHDRYATSGNGCVSVTVPSATGGGVLHYCGDQARSFCRSAFAHADQVALAGRPQCDLAGLTREKVLSAPLRLGSWRRYSSMMIVTGPSLTRATFMSAPNSPVSTRAPSLLSSSTTAVTSGSATGPGAALFQVGRLPLAVSA